jgi:hypothetical protein
LKVGRQAKKELIMSLLLQKLTNYILKHSSDIESDIVCRLKETGGEIRLENMNVYIEGHDYVDIRSVALTEGNDTVLPLSDGSTIGLDCLDGLQLLRVYDFIVYT